MAWGRSVRAATVSLVVTCGAVGCGSHPPSSSPPSSSSTPPPVRVTDLSGNPVDPFAGDAALTTLLFVRTDCPISNRYAPTVRELMTGYDDLQVELWLVYVDPDETPAAIRRHQQEYGYPGRPILDAHHDLVRLAGATITPEAAVFLPTGTMVYRGRIDDRYVAFGKTRPQPTRHDLKDVLDAASRGGDVAPSTTRAVGCFITDLTPRPAPERS